MNIDYSDLRIAGRNYYDTYRFSTRISNRIRAMARGGATYSPSLEPLLLAQLDAAKETKDKVGKLLVKIYRASAPPAVVKFQQETPGLGEMWVARLVGEVGDFRTYTEAWWESGAEAEELDEPGDDGVGAEARTFPKRVLATGEVKTTGVRELWTYCGHGDASRKRRRGQTQEEALASGNPAAKMIVHQMAEFALRLNGEPDKNGKPRAMTPYYPAYLAARQRAEELHPDWNKGHVYNYAVRKVGKAILKDLWRVQHGFEPAYGARTPWTPREEAA